MSINLYLKASRQVFTKSGKADIQTEHIDLFQTPSQVTRDILSNPTFEAQLSAYCEWADGYNDRFNNQEEWWEIYDSVIRDKEEYMTFESDIGRCLILGYPTHIYEDVDHLVLKVVLKGEPEFDKVLESRSDDVAPPYEEYEENGFTRVGYRLVKELPYSRNFLKRIQDLIDNEYELEFYWL